MQDQSAMPHWVFQVLQNLAWCGAGGVIVKLITLWQNRQKPIVEVKKTEAETTEITIRSHATAGDSLTRMMDRLEKAVASNENLRSQRDDLQEKCDKRDMELEFNERQMRKLKGLLDIHGIKFSEMDEPNK